MTGKSNYDVVQKTLNQCMNILRQIRIDELDDTFEEREEYVRLSKQNKEVCENLENSLNETQKEMFRQFIDTNVNMYASKGLFYYIHGFEDCQILFQLIHELSEGKISISPIDEKEKIEDWTSFDNDIGNLTNPQNQCKCKDIECILEISRKLDSLLIKYNGGTREE